MEDLFMTTLYSSGVLRYAENNSDMDMKSKVLFTKKGSTGMSLFLLNCGKFLIALITKLY